jgi:chitinase
MLRTLPLFRRFIFVVILAAVAGHAWGAEPVVAGYVFPRTGAIGPGQIGARAMNRINYAFAGIVNGRMTALNAYDAENLKLLTALRRENRSLKVLISVGGWLGSGGFSDLALGAQSRAQFIDSVMELLKQYDLDGLDVDWEYPGLVGAGNKFRAEDKLNFTLLLKELRARFDAVRRQTHKRLLLTIAAAASDEFLAHAEMGKAQQYLDAVNLMTYDAYEPGSDQITGNHAPLFPDASDPKQESADRYVKELEAAGVPAAKIILGVPFYGHMWGQVANTNHGLFQPGKPVPNGSAPYSLITGSMLNHGYARFWDAQAKVPWLYSDEKQIFVSYEDPESLQGKCKYVVARGLGGVMFWNYFDDPSGELLGTIDHALGRAAAGGQAGK